MVKIGGQTSTVKSWTLTKWAGGSISNTSISTKLTYMIRLLHDIDMLVQTIYSYTRCSLVLSKEEN
jgi:hypothetical protein